MTETDIETFYDIVCQGGGFAHSCTFENRVPRIRAGEFSPLFMLQFMLKDARLAAEQIENAAEKLPLLASVIETLDEGEKARWGKEDFSAVVRVLEERTGTSMVESHWYQGALIGQRRRPERHDGEKKDLPQCRVVRPNGQGRLQPSQLDEEPRHTR